MRYTEEEKAELVRQLGKLHDDEGLGPKRAADRLGIHYRTAVRLMMENGMVPRSRPRKAVRAKVDEIEKKYGHSIEKIIEAFRRKGVGQLDAAERLGISNVHLRNICDSLRIPRLGRNNRNWNRPTYEQSVAASKAAAEKTSHKLTLGGVTKTLTEWCVELNLPKHVFYGRVKRGWPEENLLSGVSPFEKGKGHGGRRV